MLKEVGASGQISLGREYAGRRYQVIAHSDGRLELVPVPEVVTAGPASQVNAPDGWVPPGGYGDCTQWALDNRAALEYYAQQVEAEGTAAEQLQRYLAEHPEALDGGHAAI
jgi:hypothetical protein